jgi:protein ImuB
MGKRFVSIWFPHLATDWFTRFKPEVKDKAFVLALPTRGRMVITAANPLAIAQGIHAGMAVADARVLDASLTVLDDNPRLQNQLTRRLAEWSIRFTPSVSPDPPDGLLFDATGCSHLWGGDQAYVELIARRLADRGYFAHVAMADTIGAAWALSRFAGRTTVIGAGQHREALLPLPPEALRLEAQTAERLHQLGLHKISDFIALPRQSLRRRFGSALLTRLDQALGQSEEPFQPLIPVEPFQERLPCLEPISTRTGIEIALERLLEALCTRLRRAQKGVRQVRFTCYRIDGMVIRVHIETSRPSSNVRHLFKLFELKLGIIEPGLGIELFLLEALRLDEHTPAQEKLWEAAGGLEDIRLSELVDRIAIRFGAACIRRYLPDEHYWPEREAKLALSLGEQPTTQWRIDRPRPLHLLEKPEPVQVTAPIPDYPPMLFRHKDKLHKIVRADGPERIEAEWWLETGEHRDYYAVEDEAGMRYWIFRLGHYNQTTPPQWFLHGFFA